MILRGGASSFSRLLLLLTVILAFHCDIIECSSKKSKTKSKESNHLSPSKPSASVSTLSALAPTDGSLSLALAKLNELVSDANSKPTITPMRVVDEKTNFLSIDFDEIGKDEKFSCLIFDNLSIYNEVAWTSPLVRLNQLESVLNLKNKLESISLLLDQELFKTYSVETSYSWISDAKLISNYIMVVNTSISQLSYLISRLNNTSDNFEQISDNIRNIRSYVTEHLKALSRFCNNLISYSGRFGITNVPISGLDPSKYFNDLIYLRSQPNCAGISDEMFETFIKFLFESFGQTYCEIIIQTFLEKTKSDFWIPIPIEYLRNRMLYDNNEQLINFVSHWKLKAFGGEIFDSRHLVNLGLFLQEGMISYDSILASMDLASINNHKPQYKLNFDMIKFFTLSASTPWLLPEDNESIRLIGDFSNPKIVSKNSFSDIEKVSIIENIWNFFVNPEDFGNMKIEDYNNLCLLINRLDKVFPGIHKKLWTIFGNSEVERSGLMFFDNFYKKLANFEKEFQESTWQEKLEKLRQEFSVEKTLEDSRINCDLVFAFFELYTEILSDCYDSLSGALYDDRIHKNEAEIKQILTFSLEFIDVLLDKYATKAVIEYWYKKYDYVPTSLFDLIIDLWMMDDFCDIQSLLIHENITKLVDNNEKFANLVMLMIKSKTIFYRIPALSAKLPTPKCLANSGNAYQSNFDIFLTYIEVARLSEPSILSDFFFFSLNQKLVREEISFELAKNLFVELNNNKVNIDMSLDGFVNFWNADMMITVMKNQYAPVIIEVFREYLKLMSGSKGVIMITTSLLRNLSTSTGFIPQIFALVVPDKSAEIIAPEIINNLLIKSDCKTENLESIALHLMNIYHFSIERGISLKSANKLFEKLFQLAKDFCRTQFDESSDFYVDFIYAFNCAFLSVTRVLSLPFNDEAKLVLEMYEFYRKVNLYVPEMLANLVQSLVRKAPTLSALYGRVINCKKPLHSMAFDTTIVMENSVIGRIQANYVNMIVEDLNRYEPIYLDPIIAWIKNGKIIFDYLLILAKGITPSIPFSKFLNFVPVLSQVLKSSQYSHAQKGDILGNTFSFVNNELIKKLISMRNSIVHEGLIELCINNPISFNKFLEYCTEDTWYESLKMEISRAAQRKLVDASSISSNLTEKSENFRLSLIGFTTSGFVDNVKRRSVVYEIDEFMAKDSDCLPLIRSKPLEWCHIYLTGMNWEIIDATGSFFRIIPKRESILELLRSHSILFKNSPYRISLFGLIIEPMRSIEIRSSITKIIPYLITSDNFVLSSITFPAINQWYQSEPFIESNGNVISTADEFIITAIENVFENIGNSPSEFDAPVFDQMLAVFCELLENRRNAFILSSIKIHNLLIDNVLNLQQSEHSRIIRNSKNLMKYMKFAVKICDREFGTKVVKLLKDNTDFYNGFNQLWNEIFEFLSRTYPSEFLIDPSLRIYVAMNEVKFSEIQPLIQYIPQANLSAKVRINLFCKVVSRDDFKFDGLSVLLLIPDSLENENFQNYEEVRKLISYIKKTLNYLEQKDLEHERQNNETINEEKEADSDDETIPDSSREVTSHILIKILSLLDLDTRTQKFRSWTWSKILYILDFCQNLEQCEHLFMDALLETYPLLLKRTLKYNENTLKFIFDLGQLKYRSSYEKLDQLNKKIISIYDNLTESKSGAADRKSIELLSKYNVYKIDLISLLEILERLELFKTNTLRILPVERQDEFSELVFLYCFSILRNIIEYNNWRPEMLRNLSNQITEIMSATLSRKNYIALVKSMKVIDVENFISIVTNNVDKSLFSECSEILYHMVQGAPVDVADEFFEQISYKTFRRDICFFSEKIIAEFSCITLHHFKHISKGEWPLLYLDGLIEERLEEAAARDNSFIDPLHFSALKSLLLQYADEIDKVSFPEIFKRLETICLERTNMLEVILVFIEDLLEEFSEDIELKDLYTEFLSASLIRKHITISKSILTKFMKKLKNRSAHEYDDWVNKRPVTGQFIKMLIESEAKNATISLHTNIAEVMILNLQEIKLQFSDETLLNTMKRFQNIDPNFLESSEVLSKLYEVFTETIFLNLSKDSHIIKLCLQFLLKFNFDIDEKLMILLSKIDFDEGIFVAFIEKSKNAENFKTILRLFKAKNGDFNYLKVIKGQLEKFSLLEDEEVLKDFDIEELFEIFKLTKKTLSFEKKMRILNNSKFVSINSKVFSLLNYFKSLLGNRKTDATLIIKAILENPSLMGQFCNVDRNNNMIELILRVLKNNLTFRAAKKLIEDCENEIGKLLLKLYFKPSSYEDPILMFPSRIDPSLMMSFFNIFSDDALINTIYSPSTRAQLIIKSFKLAEEIERNYQNISIPQSQIESLTNTLKDLFDKYAVVYIAPSPKSIQTFYNLSSKYDSIKKERNFIIKKLLLPKYRITSKKSPVPHVLIHPQLACFDAFLQVSLLGVVDWGLIEELLERTRDFTRIQELLRNFKANYKINP